MWNARLDEAQAGIKIARSNINNFRYSDDTTFMAESEEELKSLLMKVDKESEKAGLKLNIQKTKIIASGPITSWQIDGETVETVRDFTFWGSKITITDGDCSHEIERHLFLGRKAMTNLDSILKSKDITLPTKVHLVKAIVFPVVMYGCESWIIKKAEHQRIDAFELWCWRRLLRVPWTVRRSNQSILKERSPFFSFLKSIYLFWLEADYNIVVGFAIHWHESAWVYMCSLSWTPSSSYPSGSSQCTSPEHPVLCIEPGLVICFYIWQYTYFSAISQIIPPSPSPTESKRLFFTSVSLFLSRI